MKLVTIESPLKGDLERNKTYLRRAMQDCFDRGEAPFASHALYPGVLDDNDPAQRRRGMDAGFEWTLRAANLVAIYGDYGISDGMREGIDWAARHHIPLEYRKIGENP